jgi:hypothetical protein
MMWQDSIDQEFGIETGRTIIEPNRANPESVILKKESCFPNTLKFPHNKVPNEVVK